MDIKHHIETAWNLCIKHILPLIILTLVTAAVAAVSFGLLAPVAFAGYTDALYRLMKTGREPKAQDVFGQMRLFVPLFIFFLAVFLISLVGFTLLVLPGIIFMVMVGFTCLYVLPLMVDRELGIVDAVKQSIAMVTGARMVDQIIVFIIFYALTTVGGSSFVGFLLLQPFATLFLLSAYEQSK